MIAVIKSGGKQYVVREKSTVRLEKLPDSVRSSGVVSFSDVLLVADESKNVRVGKPTISTARVVGSVIRDGRADKVLVVKYKPKVRYKRSVGHRQQFTEVRIDSIAA